MDMEKNFEWLNIDESERQYHLKQYTEPKYYTLELLDLFGRAGLDKGSKFIVDFGCGGGAVTNIFASKYPDVSFLGLDVNPYYVDLARSKKEANSDFEVFDLYKDVQRLNGRVIDGVFSFQTLSWMEDYDMFIELLHQTKPGFSFVTSLFFEGQVDARILIKDYSRRMGEMDHRSSHYNIYSIPRFNDRLREIGYFIDQALPFEIGVDLPKPADTQGMSTYTVKTDDDRRLQISGPILMSWHTLVIRRSAR
jgi:SAM-dependent methyltransferase